MRTYTCTLTMVASVLFLAAQAGAAEIRESLEELKLWPDVLACFEFENTIQPAYAREGVSLPGTFHGGVQADGKNPTPRYVEGKHGKGVYLEEKTENLLSPSAAGRFDDLADFVPLRNARLTAIPDAPVPADVTKGAEEETDKPGGKSAMSYNTSLRVSCPGERAGEGFSLRLHDAAGCASLYLRGSGRLRLRLFNRTHYTPGKPEYVTLSDAWQRFELEPVATWGENADLELRVETAVQGAVAFRVDCLQVEPKKYATSWVPGGMKRGVEKVVYPLPQAIKQLKSGTMCLWVKTRWSPNIAAFVQDFGDKRRHHRGFVFTWNYSPNLLWSSYNRMFALIGNGYPRPVSKFPIQEGWHFMAVTWSPNSVGAMHNETYAASNKGTSFEKPKQFILGENGNAILDQWVIFNRQLTKSELRAIWKATWTAEQQATFAKMKKK